jgi:glutathione synthase
MRHVFVMDPIVDIRVDLDSTFALMMEAQRRGHEVIYCPASGLGLERGQAYTQGAQASLRPVQGDHVTLGAFERIELADVDVVWMRKDPPFNMHYVFATYILDAAAAHTRVVNAPAGLRHMNEKMWCMKFPSLVPETLVTEDPSELRRFARELGVIVVKPLDGNGGEGVFILRQDDPNIGVILEVSTQHGTRKIMAQRYLPEAKAGDKRIILVDGIPRGAINRVPCGVDHRGNMHAGARVEAAAMDARDREICDAIGPELKAAGQVFVGIDVIGGLLTEVNVTSPTGIHEINHFDGVSLEAELMDAALDRSD